MNLSIQPLIDLADTDRELQAFIYSKSNLENQIDTASSVVNQHKKTIEEKNTRGDFSFFMEEEFLCGI